jgi:hypothetical protein
LRPNLTLASISFLVYMLSEAVFTSHSLSSVGVAWKGEYGDVTIAGEGLQNLGLCSAFRAFVQGGIFIVPHLL